MLDRDNILKDSFNNPDLGKEEFLEPSKDLFAKIQKGIDPPKKRRKPIFWFLGIGILTIAILGFWLLNDVEDRKYKQKQLSSLDKELGQSKLNPINQLNHSPTKKIISKQRQNSDQAKISIGLDGGSDQTLVSRAHFKSSVKTNANIQNNFINGSSIPSTQNEPKLLGQISPKHNSNKNVAKLSVDQVVSNIELLVFDRERKKLKIFPFVDLQKTKLEKTPIKNNIALGAGMSSWFFDLNNNYQTALDPADFTFENGRGINFSLIYEKELSSKFSFYLGTGIDKINSISGHNSEVDYLLDLEGLDEANEINLTMASPLGLMQSSIVVERSGLITEDKTELILDLHNSHKFTNYSFVSGLNYNWLKTNHWSLSTNIGFGFNYLENIQNKLESFDIDNSNFVSGETSITENQQAIQLWSTFLNGGVQLRRKLNRNFAIGISSQYSHGLSSVYKEADFNTRLNSLKTNILLIKNF